LFCVSLTGLNGKAGTFYHIPAAVKEYMLGAPIIVRHDPGYRLISEQFSHVEKTIDGYDQYFNDMDDLVCELEMKIA